MTESAKPDWSKTCPDAVGWWWWTDGKLKPLPLHIEQCGSTGALYTNFYGQYVYVTNTFGYWKRIPDPDLPDTETETNDADG